MNNILPKKRKGMHTYVCMDHTLVQQKLIHYKSTIFEF